MCINGLLLIIVNVTVYVFYFLLHFLVYVYYLNLGQLLPPVSLTHLHNSTSCHVTCLDLVPCIHQPVETLQIGMANVVAKLASLPAQTAVPQSSYSLPPPLQSAPLQSQQAASLPPLQRNQPSSAPTISHPPSITVTPTVTDDVVIGGAIIPKDTANQALQGAYVDLGKFLIIPSPATEQDVVSVRDGKLAIRGKMSSRPITSYHIWTKAWTNYEEFLLTYHLQGTQLYPAFASYRRVIQQAQETHRFAAVYAYDTQFRVELGRKRSFAFDVLDVQRYLLCLNATTIRTDAQKCYRCQTIGHSAKECTFPEGPSTQTGATKEICNNFNDKYCNYKGCQRQHICRHCKGPRPASQCGCKGGTPSPSFT